MDRPLPRERRAFTLVELLVVISVISVLIALLLPALGKARDSSRVVACMARMRTLGTMTAFYADANRDFMPRSMHSAAGSHSAPWGYAFFEYFTHEVFTSEDAAWHAVLNTHYRCPFDKRTERWSYGYNVYYELTTDETLGRTWRKFSQVPDPARTVLFGELVMNSVADHAMAHFWSQYQATPEIDASRHRGRTGVEYLDGHAESQSFAQTFEPVSHTDRWNPAVAR